MSLSTYLTSDFTRQALLDPAHTQLRLGTGLNSTVSQTPNLINLTAQMTSGTTPAIACPNITANSTIFILSPQVSAAVSATVVPGVGFTLADGASSTQLLRYMVLG